MQLDREQAKLILSCHTWEEDSQDDDLKAALALLESDAELAEWFDTEKKWDQSISDQLTSSPVPADLLEDISEVYERGLKEREAKVKRRKMLSGFLITGALSLLVVGFFLKPYLIEGNGHSTAVTEAAIAKGTFEPEPQNYASFREEIASFVADRFALSKFDSDYTVMESWVTEHGGAGLGTLPKAILDAPGIGCNVVTWSGGTSSLICFENENGTPIHLFVAPLDSVTDLPNEAKLKTQVAARELNTAGWTDNENVYFLCSSRPGDDVTGFLKISKMAASSTPLHLLAKF